MKAIDVQDLTRTFDGQPAVDGINFSCESGEIFGFLGPNGAGKTTTIRMLTGQLLPTSGSASVAGFDVVTQRQQLKPRIGVVFDNQNIYERMSARENLAFFARLYRTKRARVDEVLAQVDLGERAWDKVQKYSNGMKQRVLIARSILHKPDVLFLDEPTRGLDAHIARDIRKIIIDLARDGMTVFLTTHYMEEADQLCGRVAFLDRGRIVAMDSPANLKSAYGKNERTSLEDIFIELTGNNLRIPSEEK